MSAKKVAMAVLVVLSTMATGRVYAQHTATAATSACIVSPIAMSKNGDMNFGNASVAAGRGGFVTLTPSGARTASGGGVTLPATSGSVSAASFTVSGAPGFTYAISLPGSTVISGPGSASMTVSSFTSIPASGGTLNASGNQSISVGATLTIAPSQPAGVYTNATALPVTVNYN